MEITKGGGERLLERLKRTNASMYKGVCVSGFKNFFSLMGSNTTTGHSSVIFTIECQVNMMLQLLKPLFDELADGRRVGPPPTLVVRKEAEDEFNRKLRTECAKKVWEQDFEKGKSSWYVDQESGKCTALYPWSQVSLFSDATCGITLKGCRYITGGIRVGLQ